MGKLKISNFEFENFLTIYDEYKKENGDGHIPFECVTWSGYPLGRMLFRLKTGKYELTEKQTEILSERFIQVKIKGKDILSEDDVVGVPFDEILLRLKMYSEMFGNTKVPKMYVCGDGLCLGYFCVILRKMYKQNALSADQKKSLDDIGFAEDNISSPKGKKEDKKNDDGSKERVRMSDEEYRKQQSLFDERALEIWEEYRKHCEKEREEGERY